MSQKRYAYLFGANGPVEMQLQYAEKDVQRLASALQKPQYTFTTETVIAENREKVLTGLRDSARRCASEDLFLVHFSGHAINDGDLYLLCNTSDTNDLITSAINIRDVKSYLRACKARQKVLILDCCHAAAAHNGGAFKGDDDIRTAMKDLAQGSASIILSACSRGKTTRELATLDGGSGFLSWVLRAACVDNFKEVSSDGIALSLDDIRRWVPKALTSVNAPLSSKERLPEPLLFGEQEIGSDSDIWFTDPPATGSPKRSNPDANRIKYLQQVYSRYNTVTLPIGPTQGFSLQAIFQPLALRSDPLTLTDESKKRRPLLGELSPDYEATHSSDSRGQYKKQIADEYDQPSSSQKRLAEHGEDALKQSPHGRIIILGGPGTGKTTTLKHMVGRRAEVALADPTAPLPLYLSLVDLARSGKALQSYLIDFVEKIGVEKSYADILWQEIEHGHAFVALDSLDEVDPKQRPDIVDLINHHASEKGNTWLIGSRFSEYKGGQFIRGQFFEWELLPMTPPLRRSLADRIFPELYRLFALSPTDPLPSATFIHLLENHPHTSAWGENPLLLSLVAVIYVKTGGLPPSRAALYRGVIDAVLSTSELSELKRVHLLQELMGLSLWLYQFRERLFTNHDLLDFLKREHHHGFQEVEHIAQRMISSGILDPVAQDIYGFRHQTFQEYLAGFALAMRLTDRRQSVRDEAWKFAWSKRTYSRWTEVLRLMVGTLVQLPERKGIDKARIWLEALIAQRSSEDGDPGQLGLALALKSLTEVADLEIWHSLSTVQLERQVLDLWLNGLFVAARTGQRARIRQLEALSVSIIPLLESNAVLLQLVEGLKDNDADVRQTVSNILSKAGKLVTTAFLLRLLQDSVGSVRAAAVQALGEQGERVPIETLLGALSDSAINVRVTAVQALGEQGERVPIEMLLGALSDSAINVRAAAVQALGKQGERVPIEALLGALSDSAASVRAAAVRALGEQEERVPIEVLLGALSDSAASVRVTAARALGEQGERVPIEILLGALSDNKVGVKAAAVQVLKEQGKRVPIEVLLGALSDSAVSVRAAVVRALGKKEERIPLEILLGALSDSAINVRMAAVEVLKGQGERVPIEVLLGTLSDSAGSVRVAAVEVLKGQGEHVPIEALLGALSDSDNGVRAAAVRVLGEQGERVPIEVLLDTLSDSVVGVREAAVRALGKQGERVPIEVLLGALSDSDNGVREAVVRALGKQGKHVPIEVLLGTLSDSAGNVREAAVQVLGEQGKRVPIEVLLGALSDSSVSVRVAAVQALKGQGERVPIEALLDVLSDSAVGVRVTAVRALGKQGERVPIEALLDVLSDSDNGVRTAAVEVLKGQRERVSIEVLLGILSDSDNGVVRAAAMEALKGQGERVPIEVLLGALSDNAGSVRAAAVRVLGKRVPIEVLLSVLSDRAVSVRAAAVRVLGEQGERVPIEVLLGVLSDSDNGVRAAAVRVLGEQGERVPIEALLGALSDSAVSVRVTAVRALGKQGERVPIEVLLGALSDSDNGVREAVVRVVGEQGERVPIEALLGALSDSAVSVRVAAVWAVGEQGERVPIEALLGALSDSDNGVRTATIGILKQRSPETLSPVVSEAIAILRKQPAGYVLGSLIQNSFLEVIKSTGYTAPLVLAKVIELLDWPYWQVRMRATETLGELRRNIPDPAIRRLLALRRDPDPLMKSVREAADDALAEILSLEDGIEDD